MKKINCWQCEYVKAPHYDCIDNLSPLCDCPHMEMRKKYKDYYNSNYCCKFFIKKISFFKKLCSFLFTG